MKILQVIFTLGVGGAETFVVDLCNELCKNNDVTLCVIENENNINAIYQKSKLKKEIKYVNLGCNKGYTICGLLKFLQLVLTIKPDVVHGHLCGLILLLPAIFFKHAKYVYTLHNLVDKALGTGWKKKIMDVFFHKKIIIPITISKICYDSYTKYLGRNESIQIDNGRSLPQITNKVSDVKTEIERYKRHEDDKIFIHLARYAEQKNQNLLIESFNDLYSEHIILLVIGAGFDKEGDYLRNKAGDNIYFLGPKKNIADYLVNSDFFILSSFYEGLPISLLEAMACRVIPVCTPVGGIPDVIKDGITGFLSKSTDKEGFERTIKRAIKQYDLINKDSLSKEYKKRFSMKICADKYIKVYTGIIKV